MWVKLKSGLKGQEYGSTSDSSEWVHIENPCILKVKLSGKMAKLVIKSWIMCNYFPESSGCYYTYMLCSWHISGSPASE